MPEAGRVHDGKNNYSWHSGIVCAVAPELCVPSTCPHLIYCLPDCLWLPRQIHYERLASQTSRLAREYSGGDVPAHCRTVRGVPVGERIAEELISAQISCLSRSFKGLFEISWPTLIGQNAGGHASFPWELATAD